MTLFWVIVAALVLWFILKKKNSEERGQTANSSVSEPNAEMTEDLVLKIQNDFEKKLVEEVDFPDGIRGRDPYVYHNLMAPWFQKLSGLNRYDDNQIRKIRTDWVDYIEAMQDRSTYNYLWLENEGERAELYREKHVLASRKMFAIEDAFASTVGNEAVKELARIREMDSNKFNTRGELAPEGQRFDFRGELKPDTNSSSNL